MNILQIGPPKCGNFWLYQIIQNILQYTGRDTQSFIEKQPIYRFAKDWELNFPDQARIDVLEITDLQYKYRISSIYQMPIDNIQQYLNQTPHVWTHSPICKRSASLFELISKKIYIIRDPRDMAISASKYYCSPYMLKYFPQEEKDPKIFLEKNFESLIMEWVWHVFDHLKYQEIFNIHISFFEGFLLNFPSELKKLLDYLSIELEGSQKKKLEEAVHFLTLKKKNPKHLKSGRYGYWRQNLTASKIENAEIIAGPLLRYLQYPLDETNEIEIPSESPQKNFEKLKQELIQSHEQLYQKQ